MKSLPPLAKAIKCPRQRANNKYLRQNLQRQAQCVIKLGLYKEAGPGMCLWMRESTHFSPALLARRILCAFRKRRAHSGI
jgi:hypothetical protein